MRHRCIHVAQRCIRIRTFTSGHSHARIDPDIGDSHDDPKLSPEDYRRARRTEMKRRQHGETFVDNLIVTVRGGANIIEPVKQRLNTNELSGKGGDGAVSFYRDKFTPKGPPSGGNGGRGGSVYVIPSASMTSLGTVPRAIRATHGGAGQGSWENGADGQPYVIQVPLGTVVRQLVGDDTRRSPDQWEALEESLQNLTSEERFEALQKRRWRHQSDYEEENKTKELFLQADKAIHKEEKQRRWNWKQKQLQPIHLDLAIPETKSRPVDAALSSGGPDYLGHLIAAGGRGGIGNPHFMSNTFRSPKFATKGEEGERVTLHLELKILSDVGLVGMPNAGKSTLLRALTGGRAKTEVANYPFTTLNPIIGVIRVSEDGTFEGSHVDMVYGETKDDKSNEQDRIVRGADAHALEINSKAPTQSFDVLEKFRFTIADNPGLIAGASKNIGLGHSFLRSMERALVLAYVVDLSAESPWDELRDLKAELEAYQEGMSKKARLVIANKADLLVPGESEDTNAMQEAKAKLIRLESFVRDEFSASADSPLVVIPVSAKYSQNVKKVVLQMKDYVSAAREKFSDAN